MCCFIQQVTLTANQPFTSRHVEDSTIILWQALKLT